MSGVEWGQAVRPSVKDLISAVNELESYTDIEHEVTGTFLERETANRLGGLSGIAEISRILGNTVVWNQLAELNVPTDSHDGVTLTANADGSVTINGTATARSSVSITIRLHVDNGHKYLVRGCPENGGYDKFYLGISGLAVDFGNGGIWTSSVTASNYSVRFDFTSDQTFDNVKIWPQCFDLTIAYGAGNEPQTVAEFEAMYGSDYKPYSAPVLLSSHIAGIQGASACEFPTQTLRGIGTAQDVMTSGGIKRNIGTVDLGTLDWILSGTNSSGVYRVESSGIYQTAKKPTAGNVAPNIRCASYETKTADSTYLKNKGISLNTAGYIEVYDPDYNTADSVTAFKTAMSGVILEYELATPTTETFAEPLDLTYRVEEGGSEAWIVPEGTSTTSSAPTATISYKMQYEYELITEKSFDNFCTALGTALNLDIEKEWNDVTKEWEFTITSDRSNLNAIDISEREELYSIDDERDILEPDVLEPIREVDENEQR